MEIVKFNEDIYGRVISAACKAYGDVCEITIAGDELNFLLKTEEYSLDEIKHEFFNYCLGLLKSL